MDSRSVTLPLSRVWLTCIGNVTDPIYCIGIVLGFVLEYGSVTSFPLKSASFFPFIQQNILRLLAG